MKEGTFLGSVRLLEVLAGSIQSTSRLELEATNQTRNLLSSIFMLRCCIPIPPPSSSTAQRRSSDNRCD